MGTKNTLMITYKVGFDTYQSSPFRVYEVVRVVMDEMPPCVTTDVLNEEITTLTDALNKKQFEKLCMDKINKTFSGKGCITSANIIPEIMWDKLMDYINVAFYQYKRDATRYEFRIIRGWRIKLDYDKTPQEVYRELSLKDADRNRAISYKNMDRELTYEKEAGIVPLFANEYKRHIVAMSGKLLKGE